MTDTYHGAATTRLVPTTLPGLGNTYLDQSMVPKVDAFVANAAAHGVDLHFNSAYRTPERQAQLRTDPAATTPAENSLHSAGFAVDVNYRHLSVHDQEVVRNAAHDAGLSWGGGFHQSDPVHFYANPPVERATAITNATRQYAEQTGRSQAPAPVVPQAHPGEAAHSQNPPVAPFHPAAASSAQVSPRLDEATHPDNALFKQALKQVHALDASINREPDEGSQNLAGALAVQAKAGGLRGIQALVLSDDGSRAFVVDTTDLKDIFKRHANVEIGPAMNQPIAESTSAIAQVNASLHQQAQMQGQQQVQQVAEPSPAMQNSPRVA